jgi:hypothetical protein
MFVTAPRRDELPEGLELPVFSVRDGVVREEARGKREAGRGKRGAGSRRGEGSDTPV